MSDTGSAVKTPPPARVLPSQEEIASWIAGAEIASLVTPLEGVTLKRYDTLVTQVGKAELLPQHWQSIAGHGHPDESEFEALPEVRKLRRSYADETLGERRVAALLVAWQQLRGKRPALWTVPDLLAAFRRIIAADLPVDRGDLLAATRDVWRGTELPQGRENLDRLWATLSFIRKKTRK